MNNGEKFNTQTRKPRILVAPLDWGLGHTTRCIPIINELLLQNCEVFIAAEGASEVILREEFKTATFLPLKGYRIRYTNHRFLQWGLLVRLPRVMLTVHYEHRWLQNIIKDLRIDGVISDNRFGLHNKKVPCIYITHQLLIKTGNWLTCKIAQKIHWHFIKKFNACWVPDDEHNGLAGDLSHPPSLPPNTKYIGPLSRFEKLTDIIKEYDCLVTLSGPEPQRSLFEEIILHELKNIEGKILLVRGLPGIREKRSVDNASVQIENHFPAADLNRMIQRAQVVVSRSGYTTIMDLVKIRQKSILVPTPGQTEQEYLAGYLQEKGLCMEMKQEEFSLTGAIKESKNFSFSFPDIPMEQYKVALTEFVGLLVSRLQTIQ